MKITSDKPAINHNRRIAEMPRAITTLVNQTTPHDWIEITPEEGITIDLFDRAGKIESLRIYIRRIRWWYDKGSQVYHFEGYVTGEDKMEGHDEPIACRRKIKGKVFSGSGQGTLHFLDVEKAVSA